MIESMYNDTTFQNRILNWYNENGRKNLPWRRNPNPYRVLVAEILLRKTRVEQVKPIFMEIMSQYPDLKSLAKANQSELERIISPIGLKSRAKSLIDIANQIVTIYNGEIPKNPNKLRSLSSIGPYISNAILLFGYGKRRALVDGNISRIYSRVFKKKRMRDPTRNVEMWRFAQKMLPKKRFVEYNAALLDFGAYICTFKKPSCERCFLNDLCQHFNQKKCLSSST